jgi:phospholipase C
MLDRRRFLAAAAASATLPAAIARAAAIDAHVRTGTIRDVEHVVVFMQENRSFDHYFGTMAGVRGFADRFPIPLAGGRTVWTQANKPQAGHPAEVAPFRLNTRQTFAHMRVQGTPHNWTDAQDAWDQGRMGHWPAAKGEHAMGYYAAEDIPFQFALADAFTLCDAYHCSIQTGTNTNRLFLWSGTNDPAGLGGGPSLTNSHDSFPEQGGAKDGYRWTTYVERLRDAGVSWRIYQDMADNFTDNPLVGFQAFRDAHAGVPGSDPSLARDGLSTYRLDRLKADVQAGTLPQVSYIVAPAKDSEHPVPSSPAQGANFTARVLEALTADPKVWSRTVLLVMFDENDGFFDHMPPPAPPSRDAAGALLGASSVDLAGEHHLARAATEAYIDRADLMGRPYGLGPRAPMYVISPWSRGGWVNSQVFDHTSVIRFLEARFGVAEPNISPWRRAVCGDLTSAFDFRRPNREAPLPQLPATAQAAARAAALPTTTRPPTPAAPPPLAQAAGLRRSRALPYALEVAAVVGADGARLTFQNRGTAGAVFHVYDRNDLAAVPRRYTVGPGAQLDGTWPLHEAERRYDLWVLGPNGFHRHFAGAAAAEPEIAVAQDARAGRLVLRLINPGSAPASLAVASAYAEPVWRTELAHGASATRAWPTSKTGGWYDLTITSQAHPRWLRRLAGRLETGRDSLSDPAMGGAAVTIHSL